MIRKLSLGFALVLVVSVGVYMHFHRARGPFEAVYAGERQVTLWSTTAAVREPLTTVNFGDRLEVFGRFHGEVKVRTLKGVTGWVDQRELLTADVWQGAKNLEARAETLPIEARGHTRVLSNLHVEPGRESPRIRQLTKAVSLDLCERQAVEVPAAAPVAGEEEESGGEPAENKKEDWWLVRAHTPDQTVLSGWILGRFIELDVPSPLPDYASSAGMRITAWFELNRAMDPSGTAKPQYLVVGTRGPEGQPCDFTLIRVFTWSAKRQRYETAFVESDVCGKLPVKLSREALSKAADTTFTFEDLSQRAPQERTYRMHQTIVRRVREGKGAR